LIGGQLILSGKVLTEAELASMQPEQLTAYLNMEASSVQIPFLVIGTVVLLVALMLWRTPLPEIEEQGETRAITGSLLNEKNLMLGVLAQFFYVGAQVCVSSFFIRFAGHVAGIEEKSASVFLSIALFGFMAGRFIGTFLMKYISPARLLAFYSIMNVLLLIMAVLADGTLSVYALMGVEFFMSIMFPTIFSLSIRGLGARTKEGSSFVIMSIVGGAIFPVIMGKISDMSHIQVAYLVPASCFLVIFYFAMKNINSKNIKLTTSH
jgi:FHS family L-fucose permease-like MFS transporter